MLENCVKIKNKLLLIDCATVITVANAWDSVPLRIITLHKKCLVNSGAFFPYAFYIYGKDATYMHTVSLRDLTPLKEQLL